MSTSRTFNVELTEEADGVRIFVTHDQQQIADGGASDWASAFDQCIAAFQAGKRRGEARLLQMEQSQSSTPAR